MCLCLQIVSIQLLGYAQRIWGAFHAGCVGKYVGGLGLPPEMIAELGQWGSLEAFTKFYLRMKALPQASINIVQMTSEYRRRAEVQMTH